MGTISRRAALIGMAAAAGAGRLSAAPLGVGDMAPDFELPGSNGKTEKLSSYRGKSTVVAAFYPKAFTGG